MLPNLYIPFVDLTLHSYETLYLLTILFPIVVAPFWVARLLHEDVRRVRWTIVPIVLAALLGARLQFVLTHWPQFADRPWTALYVWRPGRHTAGMVLAILLVAPFVARRRGFSALKLLDAGTPSLGIVIAISRVGCFLHGCCAGVRCDWPWCVRFPRWTLIYETQVDAHLIPIGAAAPLPIHPLQLYLVFAGLFATALACALYPRRRYDGQVTLVVLAFLFTAQWALEGFRQITPQNAGVAHGLQSLALIGAVTATTVLVLTEAWYRMRGWRARHVYP